MKINLFCLEYLKLTTPDAFHRTVHPECDPIPIPPGDHHYPEYNITSGQEICFPFMRSLPGQQRLGPREQINQNSAYLDGSMVGMFIY